MPGCTIVFGEIGQLAQNAAISIAAICGNNSSLPALTADVAIVAKDELGNEPPALGHAISITASPLGTVAASDGVHNGALPDDLLIDGDAVQQDESPRFKGGYVFFGSGLHDMAQPGSVTIYGITNVDWRSPNQQSHPERYPATDPPGNNIGLSTADLSDEDFPQPGSDEDNLAKATDAPGGGLRLNAGYSSIEGIAVGGKITRTNIFGSGTELGASASYSKVRTAFELGYSDGNLLGSKYAFAPTLFAERVSSKNFGKGLRLAPFRQSARGINVLLNRKLDSGLSATFNYRWSKDSFQMIGKNANCDSAVFGSALCGTIGKTTSSILSFALTFDRKSQSAGVPRGFRLQLAQDLSVGGSASFARSRASGEALIGLGGSWNVSFDIEGGYIKRIGNDKIPLFDRFYIGDSSIRGFDLRGIGPKIRPSGAQAAETVGIGGRAYYAVRTELSFAAGGMLGVNGVRPGIFIDAGSVFAADRTGLLAGEKLLGNSGKPRISVGIGLSMNTPVGRLRIDFAKPILKQLGDRGKLLSVSFGTTI